ncbi:MAG: elongation factor P maturation arginine rhamnosyltransferase EarP [Rhodocyclaceae bacterium]|nr:elongation factor P maturation arginine rhamnosyltransferase EarP [Rhodocyclaceae bacterium]
MKLQPDCDLFCRVIDNYGDIGVCWRLARQLNAEHGWRLRLWVDDLAACSQLTQGSIPEGIELCAWTSDFPAVTPAQVVIEAFACELPENYLSAMTALPRPPVWLNLEYLCVEDWGPGFHLQPSPHPRLPLLKHFFVPGLLPGTGGVLRETDLLDRQSAFDIESARRSHAGDIAGRWLFLFCYDNPALPLLLDIWAAGPGPLHCLVSAGKANAQVSAWLGQALPAGQGSRRGNLHLHALPFVPQTDFDKLLWTCDLNFVRGEDSFCRALWAGIPMVWQPYPQQDAAHHAKLAAFQAHFAVPPALADFNALWNSAAPPSPTALTSAWQQLDAALPELGIQAGEWRSKLASVGDLVANLLHFCRGPKN